MEARGVEEPGRQQRGEGRHHREEEPEEERREEEAGRSKTFVDTTLHCSNKDETQ